MEGGYKNTMIIMKRYCTTFLIISILSGCASRLNFNPESLPNAQVGKVYLVPINITGGSGPIVDLSYIISPADSGITLKFKEKGYYSQYIYNSFTVEGRPRYSGEVEIKLHGGIVASAGETFSKTYKIKVID